MSFFRNTPASKSVFEFTSNHEVNSSLVEELLYNSNTQELVVDLNDRIYKYTGVPQYVADEFANSYSPGSYFQTFKRQYGPGEFLGHYGSVEYKSVSPVQSVSHSTATVGTPKNLSYSANAVVTDETRYVDLKSDVGPERVTYNHEVRFVVDGLDEVRTYTVEAGSNWNESVEALHAATDALGINVKVKSVTINFDD